MHIEDCVALSVRVDGLSVKITAGISAVMAVMSTITYAHQTGNTVLIAQQLLPLDLYVADLHIEQHIGHVGTKIKLCPMLDSTVLVDYLQDVQYSRELYIAIASR